MAHEPAQASQYVKKALGLAQTQNYPQGTADSQHIIGRFHHLQKNYLQALDHYLQALKIYEKINDEAKITVCLIDMANTYKMNKQLEKALTTALQGFRIAKQIDSKDDIKNAAFHLSQIYALQEAYAKAYEFLNLYLTQKQQVSDEEKAKKIARLQEAYDAAQKQNEIALIAKDNALKRLFTYGIVFIFAITAGLLGFAFWAYQQKIKSNNALETQKKIIEDKNKKLQEKSEELASSHDKLAQQNQQIADVNKDMRASISYAQRIQEALLPQTAQMTSFFSDWVIFYEPKDMVSGDFYWYAQQEGIHYVAAIDCTGHGVPGAFMSMIGHAFLNQILKIQRITEPGEILNKLHDNVKLALHHDHSRMRDGMEMVLCAIDPAQQKIKFAGAVTPMLMFEHGKYQVLMGERQSIGGAYNFGDEDVPFTTQVISYQSPTMLYMFSDGYQDQFGGERGRKFSRARFYDLLSNIHFLPVSEQYRMLKENFEQWRKDNTQIDDVMVIGLKL